MSRDMKPRKVQPAKKKSGGGTLVGMFIGLVLGVVIAAAVVWYMNQSPLPFNKQVQAARSETAPKPANGAQPPAPEWGAMISDGRTYILDHWWVAAMPGIAIFLVSLAFNFLGDGLRDVLDPKGAGE